MRKFNIYIYIMAYKITRRRKNIKGKHTKKRLTKQRKRRQRNRRSKPRSRRRRLKKRKIQTRSKKYNRLGGQTLLKPGTKIKINAHGFENIKDAEIINSVIDRNGNYSYNVKYSYSGDNELESVTVNGIEYPRTRSSWIHETVPTYFVREVNGEAEEP